METLGNILNIPILQALGVIILYALAIRVGIPIDSLFKSLFKINGNGNGNYQAQIDKLQEHANTANHEVGQIRDQIVEIREDMSAMRSDISFIRGSLSK